jgi:GPH family glycoside/pentoside/hexuronide:cation symporter/glucuronide carrier protein
MSLISFPIKTAIFVRSVVITSVLVSAGYVADMAPTPELITGIKNGIALVPALFIAAGLVIIVLLYRITPQKHTEMQAEIRARQQGLGGREASGQPLGATPNLSPTKAS